jgi:hypothetical protein
MIIRYNGKNEEFGSVSLEEIRRRFSIPDRKNLYLVTERGDLVLLSGGFAADRLGDRAEIEALPDYVLG